MTDFRHADERSRAVWHRLADQIQRALELTGLPVGTDSGATIEVDTGADGSGGVYVSWSAAGLRSAAATAVGNGRFDDPAIEQSGQCKAIMRDAMVALLALAGFNVEPTDDHGLRPFEIRVLSIRDDQVSRQR